MWFGVAALEGWRSSPPGLGFNVRSWPLNRAGMTKLNYIDKECLFVQLSVFGWT